MAMPKTLQGIRKKQQEAFQQAIKLVKSQMKILQRSQPAGEPVKGNTENFRKQFAHQIAQIKLDAMQCPCPVLAEAEKQGLLVGLEKD